MILKSLVLFTALLSLTSAYAQIDGRYKDWAYDRQTLTLQHSVLGNSCYSLRSLNSVIPCNPAFLADNEGFKAQFTALIDSQISEGIDYYEEAKKDNPHTLIDRVLDESEPFVSFQTSHIWLQFDHFSFSYVPLRVGTASASVNPAFPQVITHTFAEEELSVRAGYFLGEDPNLRVGFNLRWTKTEEVRSEQDLFSLLIDPDLFSFRRGEQIFLEPGFSYLWPSLWNAELSFVVTQLSLAQTGHIEKRKISPEIGFSQSPSLFHRKLRTTMHYSNRPDLGEYRDRWSFAAQGEMIESWSGLLRLSGADYALGVEKLWDLGMMGLAYKSEGLSLRGAELRRNSAVNLELSLRY